MKIKLRKHLCLLFLGMLSLSSLSQDYTKELNALFEDDDFSSTPGKVVLVAKKGEIIYKKAFGKANLELDVDMGTGHVFRIGSITKQFTATAILKLAEEGKLSLKDDITKFIKDYPTHGNIITIEHLLSHTSGVKNYTNLNKFTPEIRRQDFSPKELIDFFKDEPMDFSPGERYSFSNSGYILLGHIVELVSGKTYEEHIEGNFFEPLGMINSFYDSSSKIIPKRISGYQKKGDEYQNSDYLSMTLPYSAGSLLSTLEDIFIWNNAIMNDHVLKEESRKKAHSPYVLKNGKPINYGYGWRLGNVKGSPTINHGGLVNGFTSYATYLPNEKIFVVVLSNCDCTQSLDVLASKIAAIVLGKPYVWKEIELPEGQLESYKGAYESEYGDRKVIALENGNLMYFKRGGSKTKIHPTKKDKLFLGNSLTSLEFKRNSNNSIVSFDLKGLGQPVKWTRLIGENIRTLKIKKVTPITLEKYAGRYRFPSEFIFTIVREGNKLFGQVGEDKKEIIPYDENKFFAKEIDAHIIFNLDRKGNVIGLTKIQSDEMYAGKIE